MTHTPETQAIEEMETPVEITQEEMESSRYSYDLPQNSEAKSAESESDAVQTESTDPPGNNEDAGDAPEENSQSQIPGDPRDPNQMQPPSKTQY
ncbi:MAG: hypothetical protein H7Y38_12130 [Armatimonadetes bacterium]|nr:hypothetical protein [Armatimonadota bacterium]